MSNFSTTTPTNSSNDNIKTPSSAKRSRSRNGCKQCKKSKIKCDELRPTCGNCERIGKSCDYSIKLTWGGRPYKVPRIEKLNPIANLSRSQLGLSTTSSPAPIIEQKVLQFQTPISSSSKKVIYSSLSSTSTPSAVTSQNEPSKPTLSPSDNLNFLLKMSDPSNISNLLNKDKNPKLKLESPPQAPSASQSPSTNENIQFFQSLEESYTEPIKQPSPTPSISNDPSLFNNEIVSNNIQNLNTMLGSLFTDKQAMAQISPWSFLEEIGTPQKITEVDDTQLNTHLLTNSELILTNNNNIPPYSTDTPVNNPITTNINEFNENIQDKYDLDNFTDDLNRIQELTREPSFDNLFSIPLINSRRPSNNETSNAITLHPPHVSPDSTTSSVSETLEPIPRGLLPLPDLLLNTPYFYDSFLFFMNLTSSILTPADSSVYINNPFKMVLPKLAMTNNGLMSLIVAFGSSHKSLLLKKDSTEIVDSLLSSALSDLLALLNNKETCTSDLTLTLVMLFTSFLAFNYRSNKWKVHMNGAKQIFLMRGYNKPFDKILSEFKTDGSLISGEIKKSKLLYFLIRWFAYLDIFTNLSSPLEPTDDEVMKYCNNSPSHLDSMSPVSDTYSSPNSFSSPLALMDNHRITYEGEGREKSTSSTVNTNDDHDDDKNQLDYEVLDVEGDLVKEESHQDIDYMLGFKLKFLPIFSQLCKLIKRVNIIKKANLINHGTPTVSLPPKIIESAINIQTKFQKLKVTTYDNSNSKMSKSYNAIIASNHCFLLLGMIQLYRRVLLMPRNSKVVQEMSVDILNKMCKYIDTTEPNSLGLILPLFIAGCECKKESLHPIFLEKLRDCQEKGSVSAESGIQIMTKCWETGKDWDEIMLELNEQVVFL